MRPASTAFKVFMVLKRVRVARLRDITRETGVDKFKVYSALKTLEKRGLVKKLDGGVYMLVSEIWH